VIFLGIGKEDGIEDIEYLAHKIINLRIFEDGKGKMNLSLAQVKGEMLVISQFTVYGDCKKGLRPNFARAASPEVAEQLYLKFIEIMKKKGIKAETGKFGAIMRVKVDNEGPVTLILDID
jgi:D-tyrosyl-tRNA(Tyr) deacylase